MSHTCLCLSYMTYFLMHTHCFNSHLPCEPVWTCCPVTFLSTRFCAVHPLKTSHTSASEVTTVWRYRNLIFIIIIIIKQNLSTSFFTQSNQVFCRCPHHLAPSNSNVTQRLTQSSSVNAQQVHIISVCPSWSLSWQAQVPEIFWSQRFSSYIPM